MDPDRSIDDLLAGALAEYDGYDHAAARARLTRRLAGHLVRDATRWTCADDQGAKDHPRPSLPQPHPAYATLHEQARRDLASLSALVVNDPNAILSGPNKVWHFRATDGRWALRPVQPA